MIMMIIIVMVNDAICSANIAGLIVIVNSMIAMIIAWVFDFICSGEFFK